MPDDIEGALVAMFTSGRAYYVTSFAGGKVGGHHPASLTLTIRDPDGTTRDVEYVPALCHKLIGGLLRCRRLWGHKSACGLV